MILYVLFMVGAFFVAKFLLRLLIYIITDGKDPKYNKHWF